VKLDRICAMDLGEGQIDPNSLIVHIDVLLCSTEL
jgi:hypothetical protein